MVFTAYAVRGHDSPDLDTKILLLIAQQAAQIP
jgi:hypothetical protein